MSSDKPKDPLEVWLGPELSSTYFGSAPDTTQPPLPADQIEEIKAFIIANAANFATNQGHLKFKENLDIVLCKTLQKRESMKIRKGLKGSLNTGLAYEYAPTGFITIFTSVPGLFNDLEPNTVYFAVGKWKAGKYNGQDSYSITARAIIPAPSRSI